MKRVFVKALWICLSHVRTQSLSERWTSWDAACEPDFSFFCDSCKLNFVLSGTAGGPETCSWDRFQEGVVPPYWHAFGREVNFQSEVGWEKKLMLSCESSEIFLYEVDNVPSHKKLFTKCPPFTITCKEGVPALVLSHITRLLTQFGITGNIFLVRMFLNCMQNLICGLQVGLWAIFGTRFIELCLKYCAFCGRQLERVDWK